MGSCLSQRVLISFEVSFDSSLIREVTDVTSTYHQLRLELQPCCYPCRLVKERAAQPPSMSSGAVLAESPTGV